MTVIPLTSNIMMTNSVILDQRLSINPPLYTPACLDQISNRWNRERLPGTLPFFAIFHNDLESPTPAEATRICKSLDGHKRTSPLQLVVSNPNLFVDFRARPFAPTRVEAR